LWVGALMYCIYSDAAVSMSVCVIRAY
jgi:hypothetical protein